jgi:hypothetical protein
MGAEIIFYIIILIAVICGWRAGMFAAGKFLFNLFVVSYSAVLSAPVLIAGVLDFIPAGYQSYLPAGAVLLPAAVSGGVLLLVWNLLRQKSLAFESSGTMENLPKCNAVAGAVYGGGAGYVLAALLLLIWGLLPVGDLPLLKHTAIRRQAENKIVADTASLQKLIGFTPKKSGRKVKRTQEPQKAPEREFFLAEFDGEALAADSSVPPEVSPVLVRGKKE